MLTIKVIHEIQLSVALAELFSQQAKITKLEEELKAAINPLDIAVRSQAVMTNKREGEQ